jgi:lambda family phage portal protein
MARFLDGIFGGGSGIGPPGLPAPRGGTERPQAGARYGWGNLFPGGYMRDDSTGLLSTWQPMLREPADESREAWYGAAARAIEAMHNSGWLAGGVNLAVDFICGPELSLNARPDPTVFGQGAPGVRAAADWARAVESRFGAWAGSPYECDLYARQTLGQMCANATRTWFGTGEIAGLIRYSLKPGNVHGTKVQVVPSFRIPLVARTNPNAVQGLILDGDGAATAYIFTVVDPLQRMVTNEEIVQARDELGRRIVIFIHDSPATQLRGISPLAPALRVVRQFDQLANATLTNALIQAIFAATIESAEPSQAIFDALRGIEEQETPADETPPVGTPPTSPPPEGGWGLLQWVRAKWYGKTRFDLGTLGKIVHLFSGEKLTFHTGVTPHNNYQSFTRFLLREVAKCLGITYEQLTGDREGATYSSERMGGAEAWGTTLYRRRHVAAPFMQCGYEAWLEEDIELYDRSGGQYGTPFPGGLAAFLANRHLVCKADWRGPPKPTADDLKTAKANEVKLANKVITREMWSADEGADWEDVFEQLRREQDKADDLKLDITVPKAGTPAAGGTGVAEDTGGTPAASEEDSPEFVELEVIADD